MGNDAVSVSVNLVNLSSFDQTQFLKGFCFEKVELELGHGHRRQPSNLALDFGSQGPGFRFQLPQGRTPLPHFNAAIYVLFIDRVHEWQGLLVRPGVPQCLQPVDVPCQD